MLTLEQFLALPEREADGTHYEMSKGELIVLSAAGYRHGVIVVNVAHQLRSVLDRKVFIVAGGESGFLLNPEPDATVRGADVAVSRRDSLPANLPSGLYPGSPLLAVEVISPTNTAEDIQNKVQQYLFAGSREVWVLYPETRNVYVYFAGQQSPCIFEETDELNSPCLGVSFAVSRFFEL